MIETMILIFVAVWLISLGGIAYELWTAKITSDDE